jgi:DNA-directed RNA polymerase subunit M/transcription elongation factor TFIIS
MKQEKIKSFIDDLKKNLHNRQRYKCPNCKEENSLLIRGPRGNGPATREGLVKDIIKDTKDVSIKSFFDGSEPEYVPVLLVCESCGYEEKKSSDSWEVDRIIEEEHGYPY